MVFCSLIRDALGKQVKYISKFGHVGRTKEKVGGKEELPHPGLRTHEYWRVSLCEEKSCSEMWGL